MSPEQAQTVEQQRSRPCPRCRAAVGDPCTFTRSRRGGAQRGQSMDATVHPQRLEP